jgi:transcriptional regulator with XRE-family HTH domain
MRFYKIGNETLAIDTLRLAAFRASQGLTLADVAAHCGCTRAAASAWECGKSAPRIRAARLLVGKWGAALRACGALMTVTTKAKVAA